LTALKRLALPADFIAGPPKRLRFLIFYTAGRLVHHARQMRLRLAREAEGIVLWVGSPAIPTASDLTRTAVRELIDGFAEPLLEGSSKKLLPDGLPIGAAPRPS